MDIHITEDRLKKSKLLQGGMGVGVSGWALARAVAMTGQTGIVSGTGAALLIPRTLQEGDLDGSVRRALENFPVPEMAEAVLARYYVEGGKKAHKPYKSIPMPCHEPAKFARTLLIVCCFAMVWLAKEGHDGLIGVNFLEKLQAPHPYEVFGAMLAGVDFVIVGAGLGYQFPRMIDQLYRSETATYDIDVASGAGFPEGTYEMAFNPKDVISPQDFSRLGTKKPLCLFIVSTAFAAKVLIRKSRDSILPNGFVVESNTAGGHNAAPRGNFAHNERGEPIYNLEGKDNPGYEEIREHGLPFWIAGSACSPAALQDSLDKGANGVQIGTAFSLSRESGILPEIKRRSVQDILDGTYDVYTSLRASPSGFPFKVVMREGTVWELKVYEDRERICDLGYLREAYWTLNKESGKDIGWRCPSEPIEDFLRKGGDLEETERRRCVCNGLMGTIGFAQIRKDGQTEPILITSGDNVSFLQQLKDKLGPDGLYSARDVIDYVLGPSA